MGEINQALLLTLLSSIHIIFNDLAVCREQALYNKKMFISSLCGFVHFAAIAPIDKGTLSLGMSFTQQSNNHKTADRKAAQVCLSLEPN